MFGSGIGWSRWLTGLRHRSREGSARTRDGFHDGEEEGGGGKGDSLLRRGCMAVGGVEGGGQGGGGGGGESKGRVRGRMSFSVQYLYGGDRRRRDLVLYQYG